MALIQCPECGKEISDKVTACPHCGYPLTEQAQQAVTPQPVEVTGINLSAKKPVNTKIVLIYGVAAICIILAVLGGVASKKKAARNSYIDNLSSIRTTMLSGAADAEELCILTHDVWYNTIYEKSNDNTDPYTKDRWGDYHDDFNNSLSALYGDEETRLAVSEIKANRKRVDDLMKKLQNPTEEFSSCYDTLDSLYDAYCGLTNLATSPSGSLTSYTESYRTYDGDFLKYYEKLENQIPEKK